MRKTALLIALLLAITAVLPAFSSCTKQEAVKNEEPLYVSVPFEDKGFSAVEEVKVEAESLDSKFLEFPAADQKILPKSGFSAKGLIENFNTVYPTLAEMWNHGKINNVVYTVNTVDDGAADTRGTGVQDKLLITMYFGFLKSSGKGGLDCICGLKTAVVEATKDHDY